MAMLEILADMWSAQLAAAGDTAERVRICAQIEVHSRCGRLAGMVKERCVRIWCTRMLWRDGEHP